jgi:hypothetical protein
VRQDPDVRLRARRLGDAEEAEFGPMLRRRARRAGTGREQLPGDELRRLLVVVV